MTRKEMGENLKASSKTVIRVFKELEEELVTMVLEYQNIKKEMIKNIAKSQGRYETDIIRSSINKELNLDLYQDKMEELIKEILYDFYIIGDVYREELRKKYKGNC